MRRVVRHAMVSVQPVTAPRPPVGPRQQAALVKPFAILP
jgi:hypothetical protein